MPWSKPDFVEVPLGMEVTAYANTDAAVQKAEDGVKKEEPAPATERVKSA